MFFLVEINEMTVFHVKWPNNRTGFVPYEHRHEKICDIFSSCS